MKKIAYLLLTISFCGLTACKTGTKKGGNMDNETLVKIETTLGNIKVKLYNETPKHRDNFIKLAEDGVYEGTLFHRVIKDFMIQAGDPDSKNAPKGKMLGAGDVGYTLPAEFVYPKYFHKKGALSAARQGDNVNPKKESSGCQFYIVTGKVYNDSTLLGMESQMNENKINVIFNTLAQKHMKEIYKMRKENDENGLYELQEKLFAEAEAEAAKQPEFHFTPEQIEAYTTVGGTPHLDGEYTVFGEVIEGMDIVDKIQQVKTDRSDRPEEDRATLATTGITLIPADFHISMYFSGLPAPVVTTLMPSSTTTLATSSAWGLSSITFTPKGLSVSSLALRISARTTSPGALAPPISPKPPASDTAAARLCSATQAMPP